MKKLRNLLMIAMSCALLSTGFMSCDREVPEEDPATGLEQTTDNTTSTDTNNNNQTTTPTTDTTTTTTTDTTTTTTTTTDTTTTTTTTDTTNNTNTNNNTNSNTTPASAVANTTLQTLITNASAGGSITLTAGTTCTGTYINVNKALTIDGNNLENLTVYVAPTISSNVTIKKLRNARIIIGDVPSSNRSILGARAASPDDTATSSPTDSSNVIANTEGFSKITDNAVPLYIKDCTIEKLDAEKDIALYLENGEGKKSEITEVNLKDGVKDFSFVEFDENGKEVADKTATPSTDKSTIGKLKIEDDGIEKINLVGGIINDVDFADGVTASDIDSLKYDKEFADQFGAAAKSDLLDVVPEAKKEDVAVVKHAANSGVYKFTMTRDEFNSYNGNITVVFMTESQKNTVIQKSGQFTYWTGAEGTSTLATVATYETPVYAAMPTGHFKVNNTKTTGLKAIQGKEFAYGNYAQAAANGHPHWLEVEDIVVLSHYRNYNKEAFIIDLGATTVDIYVNTTAVKKSDLVVCVGQIENEEPKAEYGSKISEMDLSTYTPYLAINRNIPGFPGGGFDDTVTINNQTAIIGGSNDLPYCASLKFSDNDMMYAIFNMQTGSYPDVSSIEYPNIEVPSGLHHPFEGYFNQN